MNSCVYVVTFIFLSLENVASCIPSWSNPPRKERHPSIEKSGDRHDLKGPQDFTCLSPYLYHLWYKSYQNGSLQILLGNIPPQAWVKTTRFIIKEEFIDNDAEIYCKDSSNDTSKEKTIHPWPVEVSNNVITKIYSYFNFSSKIHVTNKSYKTLIIIKVNETFKENEEPTILKYYNENQKVSFSCEHINTTTIIELGQINTTSNMIKTYEAKWIHEILNITHNGTILCCFNYVVNITAKENWITRHISNKTLLVYTNTQPHALGGKESSLRNSTYTDSDADSGLSNIIIIITTAVAVVFLLLVIIVICKKCRRKKPEMNTKVLYADLDFLRQTEPDNLPKAGPEEESPYAQIIGVMKPQTE